VAGALVAVAQALGVEQAALVEHHGVVEGGAEREARAQSFATSFMQPKVRARAMSRRKPSGREIEGEALAADHGLVKSISTSARKPPANGRSSPSNRRS